MTDTNESDNEDWLHDAQTRRRLDPDWLIGGGHVPDDRVTDRPRAGSTRHAASTRHPGRRGAPAVPAAGNHAGRGGPTHHNNPAAGGNHAGRGGHAGRGLTKIHTKRFTQKVLCHI